MSDENVPKLRLKPKLAAESVMVPPPSAIAPAAPVAPPIPPSSNEPKAFRLKPKLAPAPGQENAPVPPAAAAASGAQPPWGAASAFSPPTPAADFSSAEPLPPVEKSAAKFMLRPKAPSETPPEAPTTDMPSFPPPSAGIPSSAPASQDLIPPPPLFSDVEQGGEMSGETIPQPLTARPFPPPPGDFPPPPGGANRPAPPWSQPKVGANQTGNKFVKLGVGVLVAALILGGGFIAYKKFMVRPPAVVIVAPPKEPAPEVEATKPEPPPVEAAPKIVAPVVKKAPPAPKPVEEAEPPPPSAAFKAWVDGIRVGGVRAGVHTRVFIGETAYAPGEIVNAQLGIAFEAYDSVTRHLIFKDKTGAIVKRRN